MALPPNRHEAQESFGQVQSLPIWTTREFLDVDDLCAQLKEMHVDMVPLQVWPFYSRARFLVDESLTFTIGESNSSHLYRGSTRKNRIFFGKRKVFHARRGTVSPIRQKFALLISQGNFTIPNLLDLSNHRHRSVDFQNLPASGVIRLAEKRPSAMTDEASPIQDHGSLDLTLSDLANADHAW